MNKLLKTACAIIKSLERYADKETQCLIDTLFNEIKYSERLDLEADLEAQEYSEFGENKI